MLFQEPKVDNSLLHLRPAPALKHIPVLWTYLGADTAPRSEAVSPTKKRNVVGTTTCVYTAGPLAIGRRNAPQKIEGKALCHCCRHL